MTPGVPMLSPPLSRITSRERNPRPSSPILTSETVLLFAPLELND